MQLSTAINIPNVGVIGGSASGPSLSLEFVSGSLSPQITFTRASSATYFDSAGVLQTATTNTPRFDYNPSTLAARGLLIEESRTNSFTYSEDFSNVIWNKTSSAIVANATTAPDGNVTADKLIESSATASPGLTQVITVALGAYAFSVFAKAGETKSLRLQLPTARFGTGTDRITDFDLSNGTHNGPATSTMTNVGNGWYRCSIVATCISAGGSSQQIYNMDYTAGSGTGLYIWGAQFEVGAFPTSYIPATTAAVTRSADVASVNTLSPWYNASEGTLFAEYSVYTATGSKAIVGITDGTNNNRIQFFASAGDPYNVSPRLVSGGVATNPTQAGSVAVGAIGKAALAYQVGTNGGGFSVNSSAVNQSSPASAFGSVTQLDLGKGTSLTQTNGYLRRITYYPRRLSDTELQTITA
jgi:hypothetical protein